MGVKRPNVLEQLTGGAPRPVAVDRALERFHNFLRSQVIGALLLLLCAVIAIIWANSPYAENYFHIWETELAITLGETHFALSLHEWLNEALMLSFFLLVGMEVKEQILVGELSRPRQAILPVGAALGGMLVPAGIYLLLNQGGDGASGWGVPMSTDIAFALGILALLGKRVPISLKIFLAALAIADDIGAILVITFFYTGTIVTEGLLFAIFFWLIIGVLGRLGIYNAYIYFALSVLVWFGFFVSGIHATIAGVLIAIVIPAHPLTDPKSVLEAIRRRLHPEELQGHDVLRDEYHKETIYHLNNRMSEITPPLLQLSQSLQPWVTFIVMPLFALANAGVVLTGDLGASLTSTVSLGVILGLVIGKPLGITLFSWLFVRLGIAHLPDGLTWAHIRGVSMLAGIGFTMSLFVTELAFAGAHAQADEAKIGILLASFIAGLMGYMTLRRVFQEMPTKNDASEDAPPVLEPKLS
jgi:NhaA family Na+:H+ antiporter